MTDNRVSRPNKYGHVRSALTRAEYQALSPAERVARRKQQLSERSARYRERHPEVAKKSAANAKKKRHESPEKARAESRERNRRWRAKNAERKRAICAKWRAANHEEEKARAAIRGRKRYRANPEKYRALAREWSRAHPYRGALSEQRRRAILYSVPRTLTKSQWLETVEYFDSRCAYCLVRLAKPTMDHVEPISRGGHHSADNVVPACRSCNSSKHNFSLPRWLWFRRAAA